jgi:hypothetical protein
MGILSLITGKPGASGFGSASTAEQVTAGVDASALTVLVTGKTSIPTPPHPISASSLARLACAPHGGGIFSFGCFPRLDGGGNLDAFAM